MGSPPVPCTEGEQKGNLKKTAVPERMVWNASVISAAFQEVVADGYKDTLLI